MRKDIPLGDVSVSTDEVGSLTTLDDALLSGGTNGRAFKLNSLRHILIIKLS